MTFSKRMDRNTPITDSVTLEFTNHHAGKQINQMTQNLVYNSRATYNIIIIIIITCRSRVRRS